MLPSLARFASVCRVVSSECQAGAGEAGDQLPHEDILFSFILRLISHGKAKVRPRVVPGDAAYGMLRDEVMCSLFRSRKATGRAAFGGSDIQEIGAARHFGVEPDLS